MKKNLSFEDFAAQEHEKRVKHFVKFCNKTGQPPTSANAEEVFGFCAADAKPIVADTVVALATN